MKQDENRTGLQEASPKLVTDGQSFGGPNSAPASGGRSNLWLAAEWSLLLLLVVLVGNWLLVPKNAPHQPDFHDYFYPAGRLLAQGQSPYDFKVERDNTGFVYPPHLALILAPLGLLHPDTAALIWELFNLALFAAALWMSEVLAKFNLGWRRRAIVYLGLLLWVPFHAHIYLGSCSLIVPVTAYGALLAIQRNRIWLAGFLLAVSAVKPNLVVLLGAGLVVRAWRTDRSAKLLVAGVLGVLAMILVPYALAPSWPASLLAQKPDTYDYWGATTSVRTLIATYIGHNAFTDGIFWVGCLGACVWILRKWADPSSDLVLLSALTLSLTFVASPYSHGYDYVLLLLPILLMLRRISVEAPWRRLGVLAGSVVVAWFSCSFQQTFHTLLENGTVWTTLSGWFGEEWVEEQWVNSKYKYRFTSLLTPLLLTVAIARWPPDLAADPKK